MKVYIATKFENVEAFKKAESLLKMAGHTITHDWTKESDEQYAPPYQSLYRQKCAIADMYGVIDADAVLMIPVAKPMAGAFVEIGIALGCFPRKRLLIVDGFNEEFQRNIFYYLPQVEHHKTIEKAVESLGVVFDRAPVLVI